MSGGLNLLLPSGPVVGPAAGPDAWQGEAAGRLKSWAAASTNGGSSALEYASFPITTPMYGAERGKVKRIGKSFGMKSRDSEPEKFPAQKRGTSGR